MKKEKKMKCKKKITVYCQLRKNRNFHNIELSAILQRYHQWSENQCLWIQEEKTGSINFHFCIDFRFDCHFYLHLLNMPKLLKLTVISIKQCQYHYWQRMLRYLHYMYEDYFYLHIRIKEFDILPNKCRT